MTESFGQTASTEKLGPRSVSFVSRLHRKRNFFCLILRIPGSRTGDCSQSPKKWPTSGTSLGHSGQHSLWRVDGFRKSGPGRSRFRSQRPEIENFSVIIFRSKVVSVFFSFRFWLPRLPCLSALPPPPFPVSAAAVAAATAAAAAAVQLSVFRTWRLQGSSALPDSALGRF